MKKQLIYLGVIRDVLGISTNAINITRQWTGGQWTLHRVRLGRTGSPLAMVNVEDVIEWGQRVIRPWTAEMESALRAASIPEDVR